MSARLLVISEDPVGGSMGGNAIRAFELARALRAHTEVAIAAPGGDGAVAGIRAVPFDQRDPRGLRRVLGGFDVILALPQNPVVAAELRRSGARIVYDLYDPRPLEVLEAFSTAPTTTRRYWSRIALDHTLDALATGDLLLCASERQRDLWIGAMLAAGLIAPAVYTADPTLRSVIDVVPFGVPEEPPAAGGPGPRERFPAIAADAEIVLWNGGVWNWLDPVGAVEAIAVARRTRPRATLVFMGRPPADPRQGSAAAAAHARARELGLDGSAVFFNDDWVSYDERAPWLLAADCALSMHVEHLETRYAFRTRVLDCLWAALPVVCTEGDELADLVAREQLGARIPAADPETAGAAVAGVLASGRDSHRERLQAAAERLRWSVVVDPLAAYLAGPRAPRRRRAPAAVSPGRFTRAQLTRAARAAGRLLPWR